MGTWNQVGIGLLYWPARARICKPFKKHGIDSQPGGPVRQPYLLYRLVRLHRLAESIPGLLKRLQIRAQAKLASTIGSLESIPGLLKRLQTRAQAKLASGIDSLESIPGLSLSRKHLRSPGIDSKEPENQGTRNQEPTLRIGESRGVANSPYRRVGE